MQQKEHSVRQADIQRIEAIRKESTQEMASYRRRMDAELAADKATGPNP
jgi:hypothetical protein